MKYKGSDKDGEHLHILRVSTPRYFVGEDGILVSSTKAQEEGRTTSDG
ncbi:MAG: hypothetical protein AB1847_10385 [bacterium]